MQNYIYKQASTKQFLCQHFFTLNKIVKQFTRNYLERIHIYGKPADYVIDLGPEGDAGGEIVATGTPEEIVKIENSHTGNYLRDYLK